MVRTGRLAALAALTALIACAPGGRGGAITTITRGPVLHLAPPGTYADALAGLPATASAATMLASTIDDAAPLLFIDLGARRVTRITGVRDGGLQEGLLAPGGGALFVERPRAVGRVTATGVRRPFAELPPEVPGEINRLALADGALVATTRVAGPPDRSPVPGRAVVFSPDGRLRCVAPVDASFAWVAPGSVWSDDLRTRLDVATCATTPGLDLAGYAGPLSFPTSDGDAYPLLPDRVVRRFDLGSGAVVATSPVLGVIEDVAVVGRAVWVGTNERIYRLDRDSLEVDASHRFACTYSPRFVAAAFGLYVIEDCEGVLWRLDPETAEPVEGWALPLEEGSDIQAVGVPTREGIWIVDLEQTGEPYFFSPERRRFERLAIDRALAHPIFALSFDVSR